MKQRISKPVLLDGGGCMKAGPKNGPEYGPTVIQDIVLSLVFEAMGESQVNRTHQEYMDIAARLPPLKVLTHKVNERLREWHEDDARIAASKDLPGFDIEKQCKHRKSRLPRICRFRAGDERIVYEPFPKTISYETVRAALENAGMRQRRRHSPANSL